MFQCFIGQQLNIELHNFTSNIFMNPECRAGLGWAGLGMEWNIADIFLFQTDLMTICQDNLAIIIDCLQSAQLQETFVCKKKSRDLRGTSNV